MPLAGESPSKLIAERNRGQIGVKVAGRGWSNERIGLAVLIVVPAANSAEAVSQTDFQFGQRLLVSGAQRTHRLQDVELGNAAVGVGDAVAQARRKPLDRTD